MTVLENYSKDLIGQELDKDKLIDLLIDELPVLRAKIGLSQEELSNIIGISRQTYSTFETGKRKMPWNTFLSILFVFSNNEKTAPILEACGAFPDMLKNEINIDKRSS